MLSITSSLGKLNHRRARIGRAVVDEECLLGLDDSGRKHNVGHEAVALKVSRRLEDRLRRAAEDVCGVFRIEQESTRRILAHLAGLGGMAVAMVNFEPAFRDANRRRPCTDAAGLPLGADHRAARRAGPSESGLATRRPTSRDGRTGVAGLGRCKAT